MGTVVLPCEIELRAGQQEHESGRRQPDRGRDDDRRAAHTVKAIPTRWYRRSTMSDLPDNFQSAPLAEVDPAIAAVLEGELRRQQGTLEMIASENFVPQAVLEAVGSVLTNKYAEGYPGKRYYGGCEEVDVVEDLARERACRLFGCKHANVQPHCGANANLAAYAALVKPGDTILGMSLDHGGHLTHGSPVNFSGKLYNFVPYGLSLETETIDYDELERLAEAEHPALIVAGASAYARTIDFERIAAIAHGVGARLMVDMAHIAGLVATGAPTAAQTPIWRLTRPL